MPPSAVNIKKSTDFTLKELEVPDITATAPTCDIDTELMQDDVSDEEIDYETAYSKLQQLRDRYSVSETAEEHQCSANGCMREIQENIISISENPINDNAAVRVASMKKKSRSCGKVYGNNSSILEPLKLVVENDSVGYMIDNHDSLSNWSGKQAELDLNEIPSYDTVVTPHRRKYDIFLEDPDEQRDAGDSLNDLDEHINEGEEDIVRVRRTKKFIEPELFNTTGRKEDVLKPANADEVSLGHGSSSENFSLNNVSVDGYAVGKAFSQEEVENKTSRDVAQPAPSSNQDNENQALHVVSTTTEDPSNSDRVSTSSSELVSTPENPGELELYHVIDKIFDAADKDNMTVKDVNKCVAKHFGISKMNKAMKGLVRERLTILVSSEVKVINHANDGKECLPLPDIHHCNDEFKGDIESESEQSTNELISDSSSNYDEDDISSKKKSRSRKVRRENRHNDSAIVRTESSTNLMKSKDGRSKNKRISRQSKIGRMSKHIRDDAAKARMRQLEEARIRKEELGHLADDDQSEYNENPNQKPNIERESSGPQISEEDRMRAMAIAARFDTNREELRMKREEDRIGLIELLRKKRLEIITLNEYSDEKSSIKLEEPLPITSKFEDSPQWKISTPSTFVKLEGDDATGDESSDDDLEIISNCGIDADAISTCVPSVNAKVDHSVTFSKKSSSVIDSLLAPNGHSVPCDELKPFLKPAADSRLMLRNLLRTKQIKASNRWLARELGYKTEEDHIRECKESELKKHKQIIMMEKALVENRQLNTVFSEYDQNHNEEALDDEEEDEELALARHLEQSDIKSHSGSSVAEDDALDEDDGDNVEAEQEVHNNDAPEAQIEIADSLDLITFQQSSLSAQSNTTEIIEADSAEKGPTDSLEKNVVSLTGSCDQSYDTSYSHLESEEPQRLVSSNVGRLSQSSLASKDLDSVKDVGVSEFVYPKSSIVEDTNLGLDQEELSKVDSDTAVNNMNLKKTKNSAWQRMLIKEKEAIAREKKRLKKGGGLVEGEAEEEEEEVGIVGLEDFGFTVPKKKDDDSDEDIEVDEDDLEHVVDDLSDGEGDEEAGEEARKRLEAREEKERHKEIMRRMREGYDGRRGGIASGTGGARGMHRFDQLVAADNRDDARRLGLLNDDELESDSENEKDDGKKGKNDPVDDDDEAAFLDRILKERFLDREDDDLLEENFSDEDEEDDADEVAKGSGDEDDDKVQNRLAKQFAKRARMNRILEAYEGDSQFSRSRLIDEDNSMQIELKSMKFLTSQNKKRIINATNKRSCDSSKRQKNVPFEETGQNSKELNSATTFLSQEGSLSLALIASRSVGRKRETTFLSGKQSIASKGQSSCSSKSVSMNHVVFVAGENSQSISRLDSFNHSSLVRCTSAKGAAKNSLPVPCGLWGKVCSKNFVAKCNGFK